MTYQNAYRFFSDNVASVEILLGGGLETLYFPVPSECVNLLSEIQETLLKSVNLDTQDQKIEDFLDRAQDIVFEMQHIETLAQNCLYRFIKYFYMYVSCIGLRLTKTSLTLINRTRLRTKGQSAGYPQAQIGITSNSFQHRAP